MTQDRVHVPAGWRLGALADLVFFQRGYDITKAEQEPGGVPVVSSSGITSYHSQARARGPGVVIGRKGSLGTTHYMDGPYWPHDTTLWSRDLKDNHARYIYYFLRTLDLQRYDVGNSNPTLNRNHIHRIPIAIPEYPIQERIAAFLSDYDRLIEKNRRRIRLLERAAGMLYDEWFMRLRFPGCEHVITEADVPEGWVEVRFSDICDTVGGGTPSTKVPEYWNGDVTWVVPSDVTNNDCLVLLDSERKITERGLRESSARMVPAETILMTSRATVGFFALMDCEVATNQGFINIIPYDERLRMYLLFNLMSRVAEIRSNAKGTTYPELSKGRFRAMTVVIPSGALVGRFSDIASDVVRQIRNLKRATSQLENARDLLLPRLMNGEIAV